MKIAMSVVKRNVAANLVGSGLVTILTVLITPLQIAILGIASYAIVGFIATLQVMFAAFDLGLSSTVTRELAADVSNGKTASHDLLTTASTVYWCVAALIGFGLALSSDVIAARWFHSSGSDSVILADSLRVIALYLALRWPAALYVGVLGGLQRMDVLNIVKVGSAIVRLAGGIIVLLHWRTLESFLYWTALSAVFEVTAYWFACRRVYPSMPFRFGFSTSAVRKVWRYSGSMSILSVLAILIVQMDRLMISKLQNLDVLGSYNLAYTAAAGLSIMIGAVNSAVFPWFASVQSLGNPSALRQKYFDATLAMMLFVGLAASILMFYGTPLIALWVNEREGLRAGLPLALLAVGFLVAAAHTNAYNVAMACGRPKWHLRVNILIMLPYAAVMYVLVREYGAIGAALSWVLLNVSYAVLLLPPVHQHLLSISSIDWLRKTILPPVLIACVAFAPFKFIGMAYSLQGFAEAAVICASVAAYLVGSFLVVRDKPWFSEIRLRIVKKLAN